VRLNTVSELHERILKFCVESQFTCLTLFASHCSRLMPISQSFFRKASDITLYLIQLNNQKNLTKSLHRPSLG